MPRKKKAPASADGTAVEAYKHTDAKRKNNPEAGLASYDSGVQDEKTTYSYDPHLDPQLVWAGKREVDESGLTVDAVSLHIHERVSAPQIIAQARRDEPKQLDLFADARLPLNEAVEFYQHEVGWSNRMILGDSLLVMNSLLERESMAGKVQMIYIDPPYGIAYNSNFQPATNRRDVRDGADDSLTREPEMIKAYRDTWRLGVHSYLTYLRDRLMVARGLLAEAGSVFVQISEENIHHVREVMDELFGASGFVSMVSVRRSGMMMGDSLKSAAYYILWYAKNSEVVKYRQLYLTKIAGIGVGEHYSRIESPDGLQTRSISDDDEIPPGWRAFTLVSLKTGNFRPNQTVDFSFEGKTYHPGPNSHWRTGPEGLNRLAKSGRIVASGNSIRYKQYLDDFPAIELTNTWTDTGVSGAEGKLYVVQTPAKVIQRCMLMTTDPGDLVLDPTCGSGTTAFVAEHWGRRWITCDTSRVAVSLARQRLLTSSFPYYQLAWPDSGVGGGFRYSGVPHVMLSSIAQNTRLDSAASQQERDRIIREDSEQETLYDNPIPDRNKARISGPFTVEAIPIPALQSQENSPISAYPDGSEATETSTHSEASDYLDSLIGLLRKDGVTFPGGKQLTLANLRPATRSGLIHAEADADEDVQPGVSGHQQRVAVSFGPQYGPVTLQQVEQAMRSAGVYDLLIFAGFSFDSAAQAFIQSNRHPSLRMELAHIRPDVQLGDLLKVTANSQLFSVFGQPDVRVKKADGSYIAELRGVDIYDPTTGEVRSEQADNVAAWFLDQDYDGRTFGICQAFFPGDKDAWKKLQRALRGSIDEERFDAMRGTVSLPFPAGEHRSVAVKVIDFRGNEVIRIISLDDVR